MDKPEVADQTQTNSTPLQSPLPPISEPQPLKKPSNTLQLLVLAITIVLLSLMGLGIYSLKYIRVQPANQEVIQITRTISKMPTETKTNNSGQSDNSQWKTFLMDKRVLGKKSFKLSYPSDWTLDTYTLSDELYGIALKKNDATITFSYGAGDFAPCYYDDYPAEPGVGNSYGAYKSINVDGVEWRISLNPGSNNSHAVCAMDSKYNKFFSVTDIGWVSILGGENDNKILAEVIQILNKIEILD